MIQNVQILPRNGAYWQDNEWKKLLSNAIEDPAQLLSLLELTPEQLNSRVDFQQKFVQKVPMPFIERMVKGNPNDPLLLQVLPLIEENQEVNGFSKDPLQEQRLTKSKQIPGLLHKYQSRVLFMLATHCAINCRYCFRREYPYTENRASRNDWQLLKDYIKANPQVNEVIISGGDPLAVNDAYLTDFIEFIESIPQIIRLRIHTRLPIVIPQRVTSRLLQLPQKSRLQMVMVIHCNHPNEINDDVANALILLDKAGYQLLSQSVLLKEINDSSDTLATLSEKLFAARVQPYYLHLLDRVKGTYHFDLNQKRALTIMRQLQSKLAGFLVPKLVREEAGKTSKSLINL